jgi:hypothetical protein
MKHISSSHHLLLILGTTIVGSHGYTAKLRSDTSLDLLRALISDDVNNYVALPGAPRGKILPSAATALKRAWEYGAESLLAPINPTGACSHYPEDKLAQNNMCCFGICELAGGSLHRTHPELENFFTKTFDAVVDSREHHGCTTKLSRHDLFHGHLFRTTLSTGIELDEEMSLLGILFHCADYPAKDDDLEVMAGFDLGHCQTGSDCRPTLHDWRYRNVLWSAWWPNQRYDSTTFMPRQSIWLLDGEAPEVSHLRIDASSFGPDCPNTVWEGHFGSHIGDIYNINNVVFCAHLADYQQRPQ